MPSKLVYVLFAALLFLYRRQSVTHTMDWFLGKDQPLQQALDTDNIAALRTALQNGASVNAKGVHGVTPLEYAVGHFAKNSYLELLKLHADPNQRDAERDNAIILAVRAFARDPEYLVQGLRAGGDPNTRMSDDDPIITSFIGTNDMHAVEVLHNLGADLNVRTRTGSPLLIEASLSQDWDFTWTLLRLGASYHYPDETVTLADCFRNPAATPSDSPLYPDKKRAWEFLVAHGIALPPLNASNKK